MKDLIGQSIGRYHILEQLGEGGMATVYKAYDINLERDVAVKVIRTELFGTAVIERIMQRFTREARALAKLTHANIVHVYDHGDFEGAPYLVMQYVPGGTLKQRMGKTMPWQEAVQLLLPVARALAYAHKHGIIHRDLKPANILITENGEPVLTDFGIAKILESSEGLTLTGTGVGVGTPEYMAPEQGMGKDVDGRADIYAMGVVLYELITGRKPYIADTPMAVIFKHMTDPLPRPRQFIPNLPDAVEHILLKALAKQASDRYSDMQSFCQALENLLIPAASMPAISAESVPNQNRQRQLSPASSLDPNVDDARTIDANMLAGPAVTPAGRSDLPKNKVSNQGGRRSSYIWLSLVSLFGVMGVIWWGISSKNQSPTAISTDIPTAISNPVAERSPTPQNSPNQITSTDCTREEVFCVGLVTDVGGVNDESFNQSAWEGVQQAAKELGATIQYIETTDARDYAKNIATFADAGYDVIVTVGFAMGEATDAAAVAYPRVDFVGVDQFQSQTIEGVVGLNFPEDNGGFLVGALAAMMSKSHKIGAVCGTDAIPPVWRFGEGYRAGAAYIDRNIKTNTEVFVVYHNDVGIDKTFVDPEWGANTARSIIDQGVDVVFGCGGVTGNGAITAAAQSGAYVIGVDSDQYFSLPEAATRMLSSAMKLITPGVFELVKMAKDGKFPAGNYNGAAGYAPYHDLENEVPFDVRAKMKQINTGLLDGWIVSNVPPAKP